MLISIPPYLKGFDLDCAECGTQAAEFAGSQILSEGYFVSTVGRNEEMIRAYIRNQKIAGVGSAAIEARVLMKSHLSSQNPL
jgi:REP element-mobilizing transposase RayT